MRALFLLLLLANILFLAWTQWVAPAPAPAGRPTPSSAHPHSIRLLREAPLASELSSAVQGSGLSDVSGETVTCVSGGPFVEKIAAEAAAGRLEKLGFTSRLRASRDEVWVGQWMRVENLATPEDAANALAALKAAGIADAYLLTDEPPGNVVSLGVFSDPVKAAEAAAIAQKAGFTTKSQDRFRTADVYWLDVDRQANAGLPGLDVFQGDAHPLPRLGLKPCPAPAETVKPVAPQP
ncbi:MAG: hypothetical protein FIB04_06340 [Gammaproteobacteria bacterium]|nr:hypothetical protein [Gammaproteobacteria bacterium]